MRHPNFVLAAFALVAGLLAAPSPAPAQEAGAECPAPTAAEVERIGRAYFDAFNSGDRAALDGLLAADYRHQGAVVVQQDRALHLDRLAAVRSAFPDGVYTIDWLIVDGDTVAIRHTFRGTQQGEYAGIPASGNKVAVGAFHVHKIACGKIAETWNAGDGIGMFRQMGAIAGPPTTPPDEEPRPPTVAAEASCPATTPAENTATARRWYDEALNQGKWEALDEILAEDDVHHSGILPDAVGREAVTAALAALRTGFPDIKFSIDGVVADGDTVLIRWTGLGTHQGTLMGVAATGKAVNWSGMNAFRFACGKIVEGWSEANGLQMLRQMGAAVP